MRRCNDCRGAVGIGAGRTHFAGSRSATDMFVYFSCCTGGRRRFALFCAIMWSNACCSLWTPLPNTFQTLVVSVVLDDDDDDDDVVVIERACGLVTDTPVPVPVVLID